MKHMERKPCGRQEDSRIICAGRRQGKAGEYTREPIQGKAGEHSREPIQGKARAHRREPIQRKAGEHTREYIQSGSLWRRLGLTVTAAVLVLGVAGCGTTENTSAGSTQIILENPADSQEGPAGSPAPGTAGPSGSSGQASPAVLRQVLSQIGTDPDQPGDFARIRKLLDDSGIHYTGTINPTWERLDLELGEDIRMVFLQVSGDTGENRHYELVLSWDGRFDKHVFQEGYLHHYDVTGDEPFFSGTSERLMDEYEISSQGRNDLTSLQIARNELYARHGRIFQDPFLQGVFGTKSWYQPRYRADEYDQKAEPFSRTEQKNLETIVGMERMFRNPGEEDLAQGRLVVSGSWVDLDGDGAEEQIHYEVQSDPGNGCGDYRLEVSGQVMSGQAEYLHPAPRVVELGEGRRLLMVGSDGPSDDPYNDCYLYEDGKLVLAGGMAGHFQGADQEGGLHVLAQTEFFQTCMLPFVYDVNGQNRLMRRDRAFYEYGNEATVKEEILLHIDQSFGEALTRVPAGEQVVIEGSDLKTGVRIRRISTGETGWLKCREADFCVMPDGQEMGSWDVFEGLPFFG